MRYLITLLTLLLPALALSLAAQADPERDEPVRPALTDPGGDAVAGQSIVGDDDRSRISATGTFPYNAVVYLERFDAGGFIGRCSGLLIGPDAVLTAAHCLYTPDRGWVTEVAFARGKDGAHEPFGFGWAAGWLVPPEWVATGGPEADWAVIALAPADASSAWFRLAALEEAALVGQPLAPAIVGYPADKPIGTMWAASAAGFRDVSSAYLYHEIDTAAGTSGAPIYVSNPGSAHYGAVIGIHTTGFGSYNAAVRITPGLIAQLRDACAHLGCTIDPPIAQTEGSFTERLSVPGIRTD